MRIAVDGQGNRTLELDEVTLYSSASGAAMAASTYFDLAEAYTHFERIRFEFGRTTRPTCTEFETTGGTDGFTLVNNLFSSNNFIVDIVALSITTATRFTVDAINRKTFASSSFSSATPTPPNLFKIVGINRIANA